MSNFDQIHNENKRKTKEINLKELFQVMKRRIWVIAIITVIGGIGGVALNNTSSTPLYQASSRIIIGADEESRTTLQVIVKDSTILDKVVKELNLKKSSEALANQITVASVESSQVVSISVVDSNPLLAAQIADTTAQVFKDEVPNIVGKDYVRLLSNAKVNPTPINPKNNHKMYLGVIGGIVGGIGLAFLLESIDDRIRSENDIETILGLSVLGKVPKVNKRNVKKKANMKHFDLELRGETIGNK